LGTRIICGDCGGTIATIKTAGILRRVDRERISLCLGCRARCSREATERAEAAAGGAAAGKGKEIGVRIEVIS
jgi:hypothetical protein